MAETIDEFTRIVEPEIKKMGLLNRFLSLFAAPMRLMGNIKEYPVVWAPLILVTLLSLASLPFMTTYTDLQTQSLSNLSIERYGVDYFNLTPTDDEELSDTMTQVMEWSTIGSLLVSYPISAFFSALGLWIVTKIVRGKARIGQYFSMYLHISIITALGALITFFAAVQLETTLDITSLAAIFMPMGNITDMKFNFLSVVTVSSLWGTVLAGIGLKVINDFSFKKTVITIAVVFAIATVFSALAMNFSFLVLDFTHGILQ